jgi:ferredoxin
MDRKNFLSKAFTLCVGKSIELLENNTVVKGLESMAEPTGTQAPERPPGAQTNDNKFQELCTGCDACMVACPHNVIMIDNMEKRYPVIYSNEAPCLHCDGYPCVQSCGTRALTMDKINLLSIDKNNSTN